MERLSKPFLMWGKSSGLTNVINIAVFANHVGDPDSVHLTINELKARINELNDSNEDNSTEMAILKSLSCKECILKGCGDRNEYSRFWDAPEKIRDDISRQNPTRTLCTKWDLNPVPFINPREENNLKLYSVSIEYYYDCSPNSKRSHTAEVEGTCFENAQEKVLKKWPNSKATKVTEICRL